MRTKKPKDKVPAADPSVEQANTTEDSVSAKQRFQLSFDLNEDGSPDLSSMRGKTKEKVVQFFSDPRMAEAFGTSPVKPHVSVFPPFAVNVIYDALGTIEAMAAQKLGKMPPEIANATFKFSVEEKEMLQAPTARVLDKYATGWMIKYQDEFALAGLILTLTAAKIQMATAAMQKLREGSPEVISISAAQPQSQPKTIPEQPGAAS